MENIDYIAKRVKQMDIAPEIKFTELPDDVVREINKQLDYQSFENFRRTNTEINRALKDEIMVVEDKLTIGKSWWVNSDNHKISIDGLFEKNIKIYDDQSIYLKNSNFIYLKLDNKNLYVYIEKDQKIIKEALILTLDNNSNIELDFLHVYLMESRAIIHFFDKRRRAYKLSVIYKNYYIQISIQYLEKSSDSLECEIYRKENKFESDIRCIFMPSPRYILTATNLYRVLEDKNSSLDIDIIEIIDKKYVEYRNFDCYYYRFICRINGDSLSMIFCYNGIHKSFYFVDWDHYSIYKKDQKLENLADNLYKYIEENYKTIDLKKEITSYEGTGRVSDEKTAKEILDQLIEVIQKYIDLPTVRKYKIKN